MPSLSHPISWISKVSYLSFVQVYGFKYVFTCAFAATVSVQCSFVMFELSYRPSFPGILQLVRFDRRIVYRILTQTVLCICFGSGLFVRRLVQARADSGPPGRWCFLVQTFIVGVVVFNWSWCTRMLCGCSERRSSCSACS